MNNNKILKIAQSAKDASRKVALMPRSAKDKALFAMADALLKNKQAILQANVKDARLADKAKLSPAMIDRLNITDKRLNLMAVSLKSIAAMSDPVGNVLDSQQRPNGLLIRKIRVPVGVIAIIYESRPNVTSDCAGLCLKSGNAVILRGGKEALNTNSAIFRVLEAAMNDCGMPNGTISFIDDSDRSIIKVLVGMAGLIDLVIPRGGEGLINEITRFSKIPVIKHYKGVCHTYVDKSADLKIAEDVSFNAKVSRPGVCNAMETLLVHENIASKFLPLMIERFKNAGVEIRGCDKTRRIFRDVKSAKEADWYAEYLDLILSVKVVKDLQEAVSHINKYGSMHSDAIITQDKSIAEQFLNMVDSACVYVNSSTRFTDGGEFGFGAEIGISTEKLHARGPMGLEELTTYKYHIVGDGQVRV